MTTGQRVLSLIATAVMVSITATCFGAIPAIERSALISLYNSTQGDSWTDNTGWKDGVLEADGFGPIGSEGSWYGIMVGGSDHITDVDLAQNNLDGPIPAELGDLVNLIRLYLYDNQLTGPIPAALKNLVNLEVLRLDFNQLTGAIPAELGDLVNLVYLYLHFNQLTGAIPAELGDLMNLVLLSLHSNQLTGPIPAELGNLVNLEQLRLYSNQLTGKIPDSLLNLVNLVDGTGLTIAANHLCTDDDAVKAFVDLKAGSGWEATQTDTECDDIGEPIPTLNEWGMIILAGLLLLGSILMMKRNKDADSVF